MDSYLSGKPQFSFKPDYEVSKKRYEAFWHCEIIDRPPVSISFPKEKIKPLPQKHYDNPAQKWLDFDFRAESTYLQLANTEFYADSLPIAWPDMGPGIFSAWCGCEYQFEDTTTWTSPCLEDWENSENKAKFDPQHPLFKATVAFTEKLLEFGKGNFIVGLTDFHIGGDHLAALRGTQNLAIDMIENPESVKSKLKSSYHEYYTAYNIFYKMLREANMPITTWTTLIYDGRFYVPSNDFSFMISKEMFDEVFLPGIVEECDFYDRSIYHLDGPGALRHLDSLLQIKKLNAVQWICGAGRQGYANWVDVYRKIQKAGKGIELSVTLKELPMVFETLKPEGVWFSGISGIENREMADEVLKRIEKWK